MAKKMSTIEEEKPKGEIIIYRPKGGGAKVKVKLEEDDVWLNARQMAVVFNVDRTVVVKHINNIYQSNELNERATCAKIAQVAADGKIRRMNFYNLDMIIAVGYRVNSKRGSQFRIWATGVLKEHLLKGFTLNQKRLQERRDLRLSELERAIAFLRGVVEKKTLEGSEAVGLLKVITDYANTWTLLEKYDQQKLGLPEKKGQEKAKIFSYQEAGQMIEKLKKDLVKKREASQFFGVQKDEGLPAILGNLNQEIAGKPVYPSLPEKAAHLLYFIIKDHIFIDGNKRIGSFLFVLFLRLNGVLYNKQGQKTIDDNTLAALALLVAESKLAEKDIMIALIASMLN